MKRQQIFLSLLIGFGVFFAACAGGGGSEAPDGNTTGVTDTEIVIGSFGPLTGPAALWGNIMKGMDAAFKMINEEGGINGRTIKFVMKDDAYDPSRTVPAVRELVQREEVFAFVGGIGTAPSMSVMEYLVEEQIPWVSPLSGSTSLSIPLKSNIYSVLPYYIDEGIIQTTYAIDSLNASKIGIIYQNDDVGKSALVGAKSVLEARNLEFVSEVPVEPTDTDLTSHIARLQNSGAEVVLLWTLPRQGVMTVLGSKNVNFTPQFIASFILSDMTMMHSLTKGAWEGVIFGSFATPPYDMDNPTIKKYAEAFAKYYPEDRWGLFPYGGFLYTIPFVKALENAGKDITREKLIAELDKLGDFDVMGLTMSYTSEDHQAIRSMQLLKCTGVNTYEELSEYIESDSDIHGLIEKLEAM